MTKNVLVTGGAGFIGSHLVDELVRRGHAVKVIDNLEPQVHRTKPDYLNSGAQYHFRDIREDGAVSKLLEDAGASSVTAACPSCPSSTGAKESMFPHNRIC